MSCDSASAPGLRRTVSLPWLVLYGLGTTIGAGIYALTGVVAERAGMHAPIAFLLASGLALFSALSFAELSSRFPRAGGEAVYVWEGTGWAWLSTTVGLLVVASGVISAATLSVGFMGYLKAFVPAAGALATLGFVLLIGAVAAWGVRESVVAAGLVTLVEVGGLLVVVLYGADRFADLPARLPEILPLDAAAWGPIAGASLVSFYAFLGFEDMVNVAEEVQDVRRVMPRAIVTTLCVTVVLYVVLAIVGVLTVPPAELGASGAPLSLVLERTGGPTQIFGVVALFALLNGALIQVIKASRVLYGLASQGSLPTLLGQVSRRTRTPLVATGLSTATIGVLATLLPIATLAEATSVVTLTTFALANLSLVIVKRRERHPPDPTVVTTYPIAVPAIGFVLSLGLVAVEAARRLGAG